MPDYPRNRDDLDALKKRERRTLEATYALSANAAPVMADRGYRLARARWFFDLFGRLDMPVPFHVRRAFYRLVSQETEIPQYNDKVFQNTSDCFNTLCDAVRDARYLDLISCDYVVDRRSPAPIINFCAESDTDAEVYVSRGTTDSRDFGTTFAPPTYRLPGIWLSEPRIGTRYHLEIWIEKSTANDVLLPLGREYGINVCTFIGEVTATACKSLVDRAIASGKPVRILHVTDFDPAGRLTMSVATAVKIDFFAKKSGHDLDIRLEHVALTEEQCIEFRLPRTPLKDTDRRTAGFEARFGTGATELDALEALHPGKLREILVSHIERYCDHEINRELEQATLEFRREIAATENAVTEQYAAEIAELDARREAIGRAFDEVNGPAEAEYDAACSRALDAYHEAIESARERIEAMESEFIEQAESLNATIYDAMEAAAPEADDFEWPEPAEGDEADDPLYDSTREYIEQVDRFRKHQGKDEDGAKLAADTLVTKTCIECGVVFSTNMRHRNVCTRECTNNRKNRARRKGEGGGLRQAEKDNPPGQVTP
jgi:hypothetical protein